VPATATPVIGIPGRADALAQYPSAPLYGLGQAYVHAVTQAGAAPVVIPPGLDPPLVRAIFTRLDGLLLAGGEDIDPARYGQTPHECLGRTTPERDRLEIILCRMALDSRVPILGICRGIQVLNVATGGTLYQDLASQRPQGERHDFFSSEFPRDRLSHPVTLNPDSLVARILEAENLKVNSLHHQGIERLGEGWRAVGHAPDGLVEAIEAPDHPFAVAVQWHPEELVKHPDHSLRLFRALVEACIGG